MLSAAAEALIWLCFMAGLGWGKAHRESAPLLKTAAALGIGALTSVGAHLCLYLMHSSVVRHAALQHGMLPTHLLFRRTAPLGAEPSAHPKDRQSGMVYLGAPRQVAWPQGLSAQMISNVDHLICDTTAELYLPGCTQGQRHCTRQLRDLRSPLQWGSVWGLFPAASPI